MARRWPSTCCAPLGELWTRSRRKQIDCCRLVTRADSSRSFVCELRSPEASRVSCRSHRATGHHFSRCRESYFKGGRGSFYKALSRVPRSPPARAEILSHARSSAERHPCAASVAHSPPPSSRVEAVGQLRGRDAARLQCQPPRDVVALLHLAPSPLPLRVRRPAPFK